MRGRELDELLLRLERSLEASHRAQLDLLEVVRRLVREDKGLAANEGPGRTRLLITVREAAELAGIGRSKAYNLVLSGEWPSVLIGRARRVRYPELLAWIEAQAAE